MRKILAFFNLETFSRKKGSKIPNVDEIPRELISYFLDNANTSTNSSSPLRSIESIGQIRFPAPLSFNYETILWESVYTKKPFTGVIPWFRQSNLLPVYPYLDDALMFVVWPMGKTLRINQYRKYVSYNLTDLSYIVYVI